MLAQSTSHCYFVLPDLHKVLPSTTLYYKGLHKILPSITLYYKGRTKHVPAPLVLQNLHHVFPYTTCTTKLAHVFCKGKILRTEVFTQSKLLHTVSFCAEKPLHTASFSPLSFYTPQAFTPRSFDNKLLHEGALHTARQTASFYTQKPLREAFKQSCYTRKLLWFYAQWHQKLQYLSKTGSRGQSKKKTILKHLKRFC